MFNQTGIIILEGSDSSGKTTLANTFKKVCSNVVYIHAEYKFKNKIFSYHEAIMRKAIELSKDNLVILDRLHVSEYIYSNVYRNGGKWLMNDKFFDRVLRTYCTLNVICCPKTAEQGLAWFDKHKADKRELYDSKMDKVVEKYIEYYNNKKANRRLLDYVNYNRDEYYTENLRIGFVNYCLESIDAIKKQQVSLPAKNDFCGHAGMAKYLVVCEDEILKRDIWPTFNYKNQRHHELTKFIGEKEADYAFIKFNYGNNINTIKHISNAYRLQPVTYFLDDSREEFLIKNGLNCISVFSL